MEKRKKYLEPILLKYKDYFDIKWITEKDISIVKKHFNYSKDKKLISKRRLVLKNKIYGYNEDLYNVSFSAQELTLQHLEAIRRIKVGNSEGGIIIEDDVVFLDVNNILKINDYIDYLNKNGDILFFGNGNPKLISKLVGLSRPIFRRL